jgi:hypothetical protein
MASSLLLHVARHSYLGASDFVGMCCNEHYVCERTLDPQNTPILVLIYEQDSIIGSSFRLR